MITVARLDASATTLDFLVEASKDRELVHNTYLPAGLNDASVWWWVAEQPDMTWVISWDGTPIGVTQLTDTENYPKLLSPSTSKETETWLLADYRGRGYASQAWALVLEEIRDANPEIESLVGVVWEKNTASIRRLEKDGYTWVSRVWWQDDDPIDAGYCGVYQLTVR